MKHRPPPFHPPIARPLFWACFTAIAATAAVFAVRGQVIGDWSRVIKLCRKAKRDIVFSVECGTVEQAARSIKHLRSCLRAK